MIRTVNGDIFPEKKCNMLIHEHIMCVSNDMLAAFGRKWLDKDKLCSYSAEILRSVKEKYSVGIYVDGTSIDLGRDIRVLKRVSDESGMPIVASTGFYYFPDQFTMKREAEELSEWLLYECDSGIEGTDIRPGVLKCATEERVDADNAVRLGAIGITQAKTGLPIYAHCRHLDNTAHEQLDILISKGADPQKIVIGHASSRLCPDYLEGILKRGCYISIDQSYETEKESECISELCRRGYAGQIMFSCDRPIYNDFRSRGDTGEDFDMRIHVERYGYPFVSLLPALLAAGVSVEDCNIMYKENPLKFLSI
ncbi:MAG: phosphotriesterase [Clostridia bacterium]|nr:phosphotriesterase [Clostridia bacterium]